MPDFMAGIRLPHDPDNYRIEAFYDADTPDDVPDLHIRTGTVLKPVFGDRASFVADVELCIRMDLDWSYDDCRQFWNRLRAAADNALRRLDEVEEAANG